MIKTLSKRIIVFFAFFFFVIPVYAQVVDPIEITTTPASPGANENVFVDIKSFTLDLGQAQISWFLNNKPAAKGLGQTRFTFNTGAVGSTAVVDVIVQSQTGGVSKKELLIKPADLDLLWQTDTYTPPFYKGKGLYSIGSTVTLVAIPHFVSKKGIPIDPKNLVFTWKQDYKVMGSLSGYGIDNYTFTGGVLGKPTVIEVDVTSPTENITSTKILALTARATEPIVYEDDPLYGILYNKAVTSSFSLHNAEVKLVAEPYYFSTDKSGLQNMQYQWNINSGSDPGSTNKNIILRHEGDAAGNSSVSLYINNTEDIFQKNNLDLGISFESSKTLKPAAF